MKYMAVWKGDAKVSGVAVKREAIEMFAELVRLTGEGQVIDGGGVWVFRFDHDGDAIAVSNKVFRYADPVGAGTHRPKERAKKAAEVYAEKCGKGTLGIASLRRLVGEMYMNSAEWDDEEWEEEKEEKE